MQQLTRHHLAKRQLWVTLFAITMGIFEGALVVYIRELYYPNGFDFPITVMNPQLVNAELLRELASMLMIVSVAWLAAPTFNRRFGQFLYIFGIWDIVYYLFLKIILNWPESLLTWDVLFLIPVMWTGPVLSPAFVAVLMILWGQTLAVPLRMQPTDIKLHRYTWPLLILGAFILFLSFIWDYGRFLLAEVRQVPSFSVEWFRNIAYEYLPDSFPWWLWLVGVVLITAAWIQVQVNGNTGKDDTENQPGSIRK
ncbi:MAG: hypothetical protein ACQESW_10075 [Bacteroidota bacterium]